MTKQEVSQRYLQLFPGVRQLVDFVVQVSLETAPPQGLGPAQQAALLGLHHHQLNMAALQTQDAQPSRQDAAHTHTHTFPEAAAAFGACPAVT